MVILLCFQLCSANYTALKSTVQDAPLQSPVTTEIMDNYQTKGESQHKKPLTHYQHFNIYALVEKDMEDKGKSIMHEYKPSGSLLYRTVHTIQHGNNFTIKLYKYLNDTFTQPTIPLPLTVCPLSASGLQWCCR